MTAVLPSLLDVIFIVHYSLNLHFSKTQLFCNFTARFALSTDFRTPSLSSIVKTVLLEFFDAFDEAQVRLTQQIWCLSWRHSSRLK